MSPETRHLVSTAQLARMKETAFLINVARGGVVDHEALLDALQRNLIAGAAMGRNRSGAVAARTIHCCDWTTVSYSLTWAVPPSRLVTRCPDERWTICLPACAGRRCSAALPDATRFSGRGDAAHSFAPIPCPPAGAAVPAAHPAAR